MKLHHPAKMKIVVTALITLFLISIALSASAVTFTYDELNRLTSATYENGQKLTYSYDSGGNIVSVTHSGGQQHLSVNSTIPANNATGMPVDQDISVTFNVYIQPGSAYDSISVIDAASVPVSITKAINGDTLTIYPDAGLNYSTLYTVTIPARSVTDNVYNDLPSDYSFSFTTEDRELPALISTDPADNDIGVAVDQDISVTFNVYIQPGSAYKSISLKNSAHKNIPFTKSISADTLTISPKADLKYDTQYTVTIPAHAVTDGGYSDLPADYSFSFTTKDKKSPGIKATDPVKNATGVPVDKTVTVTFSENVIIGETYDSISLNDIEGNPVEVTKNLIGAVLTIDPVENLAEKNAYEVNIPAGAVKDESGNSLAGNKTFKFTTQDMTPPAVIGCDPVNDATGVPVLKTITVTFSEKIQKSTAFDSISLKNNQGNPVSINTIIRKNKLIINPKTKLGYNTQYNVTVPAQSVKDIANNDLAGDFSSSFTTRTSR